jgi:D-glycero-alpha-D-manno-heptose-7-phosphate kinase
MLITRTPLRISLGGGGTDLPAYYEQDGGFLVAAAINKYIYVAAHENFVNRYLIKYSKIENVESVDSIEHPLIRESLIYTKTSPGIEVTSLADIPAGTGLGSSGTFTVGLLKALYAWQRKYIDNKDLAEIACHLEIDQLKEPVGKQDQYIAAVGGVGSFTFRPDGSVHHESLKIDDLIRRQLEDQLLLFYTGVQRRAAEELSALHDGVNLETNSIRSNLDAVKELGIKSNAALVEGNLSVFGRLLTQQWAQKLERSPSVFHIKIDDWIQRGLHAGATGGKLIGAGGGGFLLFYTEDKSRLRTEMYRIGLREIDFAFDYTGSTLLT